MADNIDFTNAVEQLQQMLSSDDGQSQIQNIINMFTSGNTDNSSAPSAGNGNLPDGADMETVMKIASVMQAMNSANDNEKTVFLNALKPFLKEHRQARLEQATKLLKIASVLKTFNQSNRGGD